MRSPGKVQPGDPYSGNVPYKIAGIPVANAVSFYYESEYALHNPRTGVLATCVDMRRAVRRRSRRRRRSGSNRRMSFEVALTSPHG